MAAIENSPTSLEKLRIAQPCPARWEAMEGDDRVRFCQTCRKNVYNLSALQRSEAEALVARHEGKMCATFFQRADGTVLTADCPVGRRRTRARFLRRVTTAAAALFGLFGGQFFTARPKPSDLAVEVEHGLDPGRPLTEKEEEMIRQLVGSLGYINSTEQSADRTRWPAQFTPARAPGAGESSDHHKHRHSVETPQYATLYVGYRVGASHGPKHHQCQQHAVKISPTFYISIDKRRCSQGLDKYRRNALL